MCRSLFQITTPTQIDIESFVNASSLFANFTVIVTSHIFQSPLVNHEREHGINYDQSTTNSNHSTISSRYTNIHRVMHSGMIDITSKSYPTMIFNNLASKTVIPFEFAIRPHTAYLPPFVAKQNYTTMKEQDATNHD